MRRDGPPQGFVAFRLPIPHDRTAITAHVSCGEPRPMRHGKGVERGQGRDESLGPVRQPRSRRQGLLRMADRVGQARLGEAHLPRLLGQLRRALGLQRVTYESAGPHLRDQHALRDQPVDRINHRCAGHADLARHRAGRRQPFPGPKHAVQDHVSQAVVELNADALAGLPIQLNGRQKGAGRMLHEIEPRIGLQILA